jgi:hypothetical protein
MSCGQAEVVAAEGERVVRNLRAKRLAVQPADLAQQLRVGATAAVATTTNSCSDRPSAEAVVACSIGPLHACEPISFFFFAASSVTPAFSAPLYSGQ